MNDEDLQNLMQNDNNENVPTVEGNDTEPPKSNQNYAFITPTEAGFVPTNPNEIAGLPRPQPGMTFTPTGGSVSSINHQLNRQKEDTESLNIETPPNQQQ